MWINKCWAHASILLINRGRHHASIFEKITHFTNKLALLYGSDYKCMTTFIWNGDYVIPILLLIYSDTSNVFCVVHFIGCIIQREPLRTALSLSLFLVPFFLSLLHSHFHWIVHSICCSFYSLHCTTQTIWCTTMYIICILFAYAW